MTTIPPGRALHIAAGIIPATLIVLFTGLIALIALALDSGRRQYSLDLAAVLVGLTRPRRPSVLQAAKPHREPLPSSAETTLPFDNDQPLPEPGQPPAQATSKPPPSTQPPSSQP